MLHAKRYGSCMASPQAEHGHTRIANELLEAIIRVNLNATQQRILLVLMRETYGFSRKVVTIGYQALATRYGFSKSLLIRELATLVERRIVVKTDGQPNGWGIQKDYEQWLGSHHSVTSHHRVTSDENSQSLVTTESLVTSHHSVTTSKQESKKAINAAGGAKNAVVAGLVELGLSSGQAITVIRTWDAMTTEHVALWRQWRIDNPHLGVGALIKQLADRMEPTTAPTAAPKRQVLEDPNAIAELLKQNQQEAPAATYRRG